LNRTGGDDNIQKDAKYGEKKIASGAKEKRGIPQKKRAESCTEQRKATTSQGLTFRGGR